ncbi:exodeoxyribonuclease V subunit beta [Winogradskya consettensis]|uniref:RecBCD enzyme subunit RecB n=1 Tax=Winogradskya consettensis TaxID=113560 RepID=A0A919SV01_9ACTN|nr:UvrD-helicase domain-containing protein [Actinoplanes consettensis]GIM77543.1 RecBCD enzyme subunit RecB [Actinoplanes consettensis]
MTTTIPAFDVCGPLPTGTTVLEASAGTGKTFTIAALAARYVAEGRAGLRELLLVTFGRAATAELRQRVRERLVSAERGLADPAAARAGDDVVLALLADAGPGEVAARRQRLAAAVADFDAATIATTHQFCHQVLAGLGITSDSDPDATFVEDLDDLVTEVVDDLYIRKYARTGAPVPHFGREVALAIARQAVADSQARLEPAAAPPDSFAGVRYRFACAVRSEVERRKASRRLYCYDDMLTGLQAALADPARGPAACTRLRERYPVVLIDEFQDTDPVQWAIVSTAFHGHTTLVLIGDPKQAIYAFRGADVVSYLTAAGAAPAHATLATNWRSDEQVLSAFETVFGHAALGDSRITVRPVRAATPAKPRVLAPFRLRVLARTGFTLNKPGLIPAADARDAVATDLAADIAGRAGLVPGDVAVLVRTHRQSTQVHEALTALGVPAVLAGATSVFGTPAARDWLVLLEALEQPHRRARVAAVALSGLIGWSAQRLAVATEPDLDELGATLRQWARLLDQRGVAALLEAVTATGLPARLLAERAGERHLTDLRHIGMAMHAAATEGTLGLTAVAEWLRRRIDEAPHDVSLERSRRLESDDDAVQILTVHSSKGLEYPVVYLPFGWDRHMGKPDLLHLHDDNGARVLDVGGPSGPGYTLGLRRHLAEEAGEDLRLLYVALTRAANQVVAWWAPTLNTTASALHRFLFGRPGAGENPLPEYPVPADAAALDHLRHLNLAVERITPAPPAPFHGTRTDPPSLSAARFHRHLDLGWRRTSYSRLTAAHHDQATAASQEAPGVRSEPDVGIEDELDAFAEGEAEGGDAPMGGLPKGAAFGTLLHTLLEDLDFTATDLHAALLERAQPLIAATALTLDPDELAQAMLPSLHTPLGPLAGNRSLTGFSPADRLAELDFELPLDGGDLPRSGPPVTLGLFGDSLARHLPADDPLHGYAQQLREPSLSSQRLRGYLTGSIDAVLRLPGPRYLVVDYKSNWLGGAPLTAYAYRSSALAEAMIAAHYPLQALLYAVALHRYLRWRQPGYDPRTHLGGVLYLFLRGMNGPETPPGQGVFSWRPPAALIEELSDLL